MNDLKSYYGSYMAGGTARPIELYNPTSILSALCKSSIEDYWVATGLLTIIIHFIYCN
jgi:hypothetical protein